jgi:hypothetical protein
MLATRLVAIQAKTAALQASMLTLLTTAKAWQTSTGSQSFSRMMQLLETSLGRLSAEMHALVARIEAELSTAHRLALRRRR